MKNEEYQIKLFIYFLLGFASGIVSSAIFYLIVKKVIWY